MGSNVGAEPEYDQVQCNVDDTIGSLVFHDAESFPRGESCIYLCRC